jgi:valyl-tRNA synthetase
VRVEQLLDGAKKKLANESFVGKAPADVVEKERSKLVGFQQTLDKLRDNIESL